MAVPAAIRPSEATACLGDAQAALEEGVCTASNCSRWPLRFDGDARWSCPGGDQPSVVWQASPNLAPVVPMNDNRSITTRGCFSQRLQPLDVPLLERTWTTNAGAWCVPRRAAASSSDQPPQAVRLSRRLRLWITWRASRSRVPTAGLFQPRRRSTGRRSRSLPMRFPRRRASVTARWRSRR